MHVCITAVMSSHTIINVMCNTIAGASIRIERISWIALAAVRPISITTDLSAGISTQNTLINVCKMIVTVIMV